MVVLAHFSHKWGDDLVFECMCECKSLIFHFIFSLDFYDFVLSSDVISRKYDQKFQGLMLQKTLFKTFSLALENEATVDDKQIPWIYSHFV